MLDFHRHLRSVLVAIAVLVLSAGAVFAAHGVANDRPATTVVESQGDDNDQGEGAEEDSPDADEDADEGADEDSPDADEDADEDAEEDADQDADQEQEAPDPAKVADEYVGSPWANHGDLVSEAAQADATDAWTDLNHGAFVSCVAKLHKAEGWDPKTLDLAALTPADCGLGTEAATTATDQLGGKTKSHGPPTGKATKRHKHSH
ncbi:MAG: hypothetical protein ACJ761_03110 [Chloroflexota bacterium]